MSFAPLHYRKLRIAEYGAFAILPLYTRCFGEGLKKLCDDRGRIVLDGRAPTEVIARRGGAGTNERRRIAADVIELLRVGWLREDSDALVVVEQEQDWEELDSSRALNMRPTRTRVASASRPTSARLAPDSHPSRSRLAPDVRHDVDRIDLSTRNDSADTLASDKMIGDRSEEINKIRSSPTGEGVQGEGESIQPTQEPKAPEAFALAYTSAAEPPKAKGRGKIPVGTPKAATEPTEHLLPPDWAPTPKHYELGAKYGMAKYQVDFEAMAFRNHAEGCNRKQMLWNGAFSTWLLKDIKDRGDRPHRAPKPVAVEPPRPVPGRPALHPNVAEESRKFGELMEQNPNMDLREVFEFSNIGKPFSFDDAADMVDA